MNKLALVLLLIGMNVFAEDGTVGTTSQGTVGIFIVIPPKPIPDEITEENPRPWEERCSERNTECDIIETETTVEVIVKPI